MWISFRSNKKAFGIHASSWFDLYTKTKLNGASSMEAKASVYIPHAFRSFQGFSVRDIKESVVSKEMEIILEKAPDKVHVCGCCGERLGVMEGGYWVTARHLKCFGWSVKVTFYREKRHCSSCRKTRSELVEWLCPTSPHITLELAWWINRLSEVSSVMSVSRLESVDKMSCYKVDHYILARMLQGYAIPKVRRISVDEVYARSPKQQKKHETRDDLFLTVIVDQRTHKVIWVSQSRRQEALDQFFELLGPEACKEIEVVATDQHDAYAASVQKYCPNAVVVWDRFHLVQKFNEALNEERKEELGRIDPEGKMGDLMNGKYRYVFLSKARSRSKTDQRHIDQVMQLNQRMAKLELIKEAFHQIFDIADAVSAQIRLGEAYQWAMQINADHIVKWMRSIMNENNFWHYWTYRVTSGASEGINRAIKGLKWQAYGYKNMAYFALKIMQKCGYLNHRFYFMTIST
jgi:transposase